MLMKNKVVIVNKDEIAIAGTVCSQNLVENGIILKPSDKSGILFWFSVNDIKKIILPDASVVSREQYDNLAEVLDKFSEKYQLEE